MNDIKKQSIIKFSFETNKLLYYLNKIPFINLKRKIWIGPTFNFIINLLMTIIYITILIYIPYKITNNKLLFYNIFIFLSLFGAFFNEQLTEKNDDKIIAESLKLNKKNHSLSLLFLYLLETFLINFITILILHFDILTALFLSIIVVSLKLIVSTICFITNKKIIIIELLSLLLAYLPLINGYYLVTNLFTVIIPLIILDFICLYYLNKKENYDNLYNLQNTNKKQKTKDINYTSLKNKIDYKKFNYLFISRNKKTIFSFQIITSIMIYIFLIVTIILNLSSEISKEVTYIFLQDNLTLFIMLIYLINNINIFQEMYTKCDKSMLTYQFFIQNKTYKKILNDRLFKLLKINLIPIIILCILLLVNMLIVSFPIGQSITYILILIFAGIAFSTYNLIVYYKFNIKKFNQIFILTFLIIYIISKFNYVILPFIFIALIFINIIITQKIKFKRYYNN